MLLYNSIAMSNGQIIKNTNETIELIQLKDNKNNFNIEKKRHTKIEYSIDKLGNTFEIYLLTIILNKTEITKTLISNSDVIVIEDQNSRFLKFFEKISKMFLIDFNYIKKLLEKYFSFENEIMSKCINVKDLDEALKTRNMKGSEYEEIISEYSKFDEKISIKNESLFKSPKNTKNNPSSKNSKLLKMFSEQYSTNSKKLSSVTVINRIKVLEFLNFNINFKISTEEFIRISLHYLEIVEKIINDFLSYSFKLNDIENSFVIKYSQIKSILEPLVKDSEIKAVEEEILKFSKEISIRDFFTISEFHNIVLATSYLLKLLIQKSSLMDKNRLSIINNTK